VQSKVRHFLELYRERKYEVVFIQTYFRYRFEPDISVRKLADFA
jgi:hypothetical protein